MITIRTADDAIVVQLVLTFCLVANGASCIEHRPMMDGRTDIMSCLTLAQPLAAEFVRNHPAHRLTSWRREIGKRAERPAWLY